MHAPEQSQNLSQFALKCEDVNILMNVRLWKNFSDLHLAFDFLPHSWNGLLLLTGETDDMTGDYLALLLR